MNGVQSLPTSYQVSSLTMPAAPVSSLTTPATPVQSLPTSFQAPELPACLSTPPRLSSAQVPSPIPAAVKSPPAFQAQSDTVIGASAAAKLGPAQAERFIPNQRESSPKARFAEPLAPASGPGSQVGVASSRSSPTAVQRMIQDRVYAQPLNFSQVGAESSFPSSRISTGSDKEERWTTPVRRLDASLPLEPEDRCTCGSTFVPDALFCQTCGRSRRQDSGTKEIRFDTRTPPQVSYPVSFPAQASFPAGCQACPARSALHGRAVSPVTLPPRGAASMATSPPWQGAAQARSLTPPPSQRAFASRLSLPARPAMAGARGGARPPSVPPLVLPGGAFAR
ncbi:unnamed protein product [Effrenium voratum]|nr:unnamed protein product [Effrenium voratum]